jgi:hypothetical protein
MLSVRQRVARSAGLWGTLVLGLACSACQPRLNDEECFQLLDRYTDKVIDQARPGAGQAERMELAQKARKLAQQDPAFTECSSRVTRKAFTCAMDAHNADQMERCLL